MPAGLGWVYSSQTAETNHARCGDTNTRGLQAQPGQRERKYHTLMNMGCLFLSERPQEECTVEAELTECQEEEEEDKQKGLPHPDRAPKGAIIS